MKSKRLFGGTRFVVVMIAVTCIVVGMTTLSSMKRETSFEERMQQKKARLINAKLHIRNLTQSLVVISLEKDIDRDLVRVKLRNDYGKTITAYELSVGSGTIQTQCITEETDDGTLMHPGDIREELYPLQDDVDERGIGVLAVIFEDKTSDGEPRYVQEMQEYRRGLKMAVEHTLLLVYNTLQLPTREVPQALAKLEVSSASASDQEKLPHFVKLGLRDATARIARDLARIRTLLRSTQQQSYETAAKESAKLADRLRGTLSKL